MIDKKSYKKIELMKPYTDSNIELMQGCEYCKSSKYKLLITSIDKDDKKIAEAVLKLSCGYDIVEYGWSCNNFKFKDAGKKKMKREK